MRALFEGRIVPPVNDRSALDVAPEVDARRAALVIWRARISLQHFPFTIYAEVLPAPRHRGRGRQNLSRHNFLDLFF